MKRVKRGESGARIYRKICRQFRRNGRRKSVRNQKNLKGYKTVKNKSSEFRQKFLDCLSEIRRIFNNLKYFEQSKMFLGNLSFFFLRLTDETQIIELSCNGYLHPSIFRRFVVKIFRQAHMLLEFYEKNINIRI